jgi:hypothetical protein
MSSNVVGWLVAIPIVLVLTVVVIVSDQGEWSTALTFGLGFGILAVGAGGFVTWFLLRKRKRKAALPGVAARMGLMTQQAAVGQAVIGLPFELFGRGSDRTAENVIGGNVDQHSVTMFDYTYSHSGYNPTTQGSHEQSFDYSCAVIDVPAVIPQVSITREGFLSKIARAAGIEDRPPRFHPSTRPSR